MRDEMRGDEPTARGDVVCAERQMENAHVSVRIHDNCSLDLFDKRGGRVYTGLYVWEEIPQTDGAYRISNRSEPRATMKPELIESSASRAVYRVIREIFVRTEADGENVKLDTDYRLDADSPLVLISTREESAAGEKRSRALFPVGIRSNSHKALTRSGLVRRENLPKTAARSACILLEDRFGGLAVCAREAFEYEWITESNTVAIKPARRKNGYSVSPRRALSESRFECAIAPYAAGEKEEVLRKIRDYLHFEEGLYAGADQRLRLRSRSLH